MTIKLYDDNSYLKEFEAGVVCCKALDNRFEVVLNQTAFFPESGGQPCDIGTLDGVRVLDVIIEDDIIYHYTEAPLEVGKTVTGVIDFERRFAFMQNHSGEHIVSGIVNSLYGFDNVGFHLGCDFATLDFNGILDRKQLDEIETLANKCVWENLSIKTYYPMDTELSAINYRSKKELDGKIRIVEIENTDVCACCAPHVKKTGEIGLIKLLDAERMRGGVRILMKCGIFALKDYRNKYLNTFEISLLLSAKQEQTFDAVKQLDLKLSLQKQEISALKKRLITSLVASQKAEQALFFEDGFDVKELTLLADALHKTHSGLKAVFSAAEQGFNFAICDDETKLDKLFSNFKASFSVRGGGRNGMVQGSVNAEIGELRDFFEKQKGILYGLDRD